MLAKANQVVVALNVAGAGTSAADKAAALSFVESVQLIKTQLNGINSTNGVSNAENSFGNLAEVLGNDIGGEAATLDSQLDTSLGDSAPMSTNGRKCRVDSQL